MPRAVPLALGAGRKGTALSYCSSVMGLRKPFNHCLLHTQRHAQSESAEGASTWQSHYWSLQFISRLMLKKRKKSNPLPREDLSPRSRRGLWAVMEVHRGMQGVDGAGGHPLLPHWSCPQAAACLQDTATTRPLSLHPGPGSPPLNSRHPINKAGRNKSLSTHKTHPPEHIFPGQGCDKGFKHRKREGEHNNNGTLGRPYINNDPSVC